MEGRHMPKVMCDCQSVIRDTTDNLPYKARFIPDQNAGPFLETVTQALAEFVDLSMQGRREEWIAKCFQQGYPRDLPNEEVIGDYLSGRLAANSVLTYQCEGCGRLLIYRDRQGSARVFVPNGEWKGTFERITPREG